MEVLAESVAATLPPDQRQELQREKLPAGETGKYGNFDAIPVTSRVTRLFLGIQTQCTQCHDHPMNKQWLQADFWGVNAFFRQARRSATPSPAPGMGNNAKMDNVVQITLSDDPALNPV